MIKKFVFTILAITTLLLAQTNIAMAVKGSTEDAGSEEGAGPSDTGDDTSAPTYEGLESFDVGGLLTTDGQNQSYLQDEKYAPILSFILDIIDFLIKVIGTFCMVLIIIGGLLMLASQGDDSKVQKGKAIITQAIIGLILTLASYILVTFVQSLLYVQS